MSSTPTDSPTYADLPAMQQGTPTLSEVDALLATDFWKQVKAYSDGFLKTHDAALAGYGRHWGDDPMRLWSRRWEYPFAVRSILAHAAQTGKTDLFVCDAGSGVTFLPYLLCDRLDGTRFACVDTNASYIPMFDAVNKTVEHDRVTFKTAAIQNLDFADGELDVMCCVSVLEHTGNYQTIINEMARVVRPGGRLVLTFDLSLAGKAFELKRSSAREVFDALAKHFETDGGKLMKQADLVYSNVSGRLSTTEIRNRSPELLPWKYPKLQAIYDLARGYGWTGGFRAVAPFCVDLARRAG